MKLGGWWKEAVAAGRPEVQVFARVLIDEGETAVFFRRKSARQTKRRWIRAGDVRETLLVAACRLGAALLPVQAWNGFVHLAVASGLSGVRRSKLHRRFRPAVEAIMGPIDPRRLRTLFEAYRRNAVSYRLMAAREAIASRRDDHVIEVNGLSGLRASLSHGHGAVVWANQFFPQTIIGKRALWEAGLEPVQVTAEIHGFRTSAYGRTVLNPLLINAENRYLSKRLTIRNRSEPAVTRGVLRSLADGGVVIVTNNDYAGSAFVRLPLGTSGSITMATTIPRLAIRFRTPLFSMTTVELVPFARYRVDIEPLFAPDNRGDISNEQDEQEQIGRIVVAARDRLVTHIYASPDQYMGWRRSEMPDAAQTG